MNPLTPKDVEIAAQVFTMEMLGLDPQDPESPKRVRISWPVLGQPAPSIEDDICYIRVQLYDDDNVNCQRDVKYPRSINGLITTEETYIRVWQIFWVLYGPNGGDSARKIRSGILKDFIHDEFAANNLFAVTELLEVQRIKEEFADQWWERCDFSAEFNELVTETDEVNAVASAEVIVNTEDGETRDINVTTS